MSRINGANKKKALTVQKAKLLEELKYYKRQIEEAKLNQINEIEYEESSDSDTELPFFTIEPSITTLKIEYSALQTCFDATQELTSLQVLQSEVNVLVEDPKYDGEALVTEEGIWREVTVECRVDLVPFSMTFYVHKPSRRFGGLSYRGLKVTALKKPHEIELNKTILDELKKPSDAFEVLKAYSSAHRSRRTTLAKLATLHSSTLRMAPLDDGGYQLKCGNLLEISWTLQNKSSPVAPFHHRLKFDLEYMDKAHIQTIMAAHKALSDPTIDTEERTTLLSKIITVCLEVQGINPPESTSESETAPSKADLPVKRRRDEETMGPPKAPPKKSRPKGKENKEDNRSNEKPTKDTGNRGSGMNIGNEASTGAKTRVIGDTNMKSKEKAYIEKNEQKDKKKSHRTEDNVKNKGFEVVKEVGESNRKEVDKYNAKDSESNQNIAKSKNNGDQITKKVSETRDKKKPNSAIDNRAKDDVRGVRENGEYIKKVSNSEVKKSKDSNKDRIKKVTDSKDRKKDNNAIQNNNIKDIDVDNVEKVKTKDKKGTGEVIGSNEEKRSSEEGTGNKDKKKDNKAIHNNIVKDIDVDNVEKVKSKDKKGTAENIGSKGKDTEINKETSANKVKSIDRKVNERQDVAKKSVMKRKEAENNLGGLVKKNIEKTIQKTTNEPDKSKDHQFKKKQNDKVKQVTNTVEENTKKTTKEQNVEPTTDPESTKTLKKSTNSASSGLKTKLLKNQFSNKKSSDMNNIVLKKNTRIPQKAPNGMQKIMKKNPLRISPRKSISKLKGVPPKIRKPFTHIPRLVTKPFEK